MHEIQKRLMALAEHDDLARMSLRKIGERIGVKHAAQVRHHLNYLVSKGYLVKNAAGSLVVPRFSSSNQNIFTIPFMGEADCGEAAMLATGQIQGYLSISPKLTHCTDTKNLYALKARGDSMDEANIRGKSIQDSDYVLVQKCSFSEMSDGDYVVSMFDGLANIKRFHLDRPNERVILKSESHKIYPPIIIASEDMGYYEVLGKVIEVVKGIGHLS